jgi:hypothetical protein
MEDDVCIYIRMIHTCIQCEFQRVLECGRGRVGVGLREGAALNDKAESRCIHVWYIHI